MRAVNCINPLIAAGLLVAVSASARAQGVAEALRELKPSAGLRLIDPTPSPPDAWPWQVMIVIPLISKDGKEQGAGMCGGSLISRQWVLTAAHCFGDKDWELDRKRSIAVAERRNTTATRSFTDIDTRSVHRVASPIPHPDYRPDTYENDIALLHLGEAARAPAVPILLGPNSTLENPPARATVTGWGRVREIKKAGNGYIDVTTQARVRPEDVEPDRLMEIEVPLVATDQCHVSNKEAGGVIDNRTLCAGFPEGGKDACQGDSGGPMLVHTNRGRWVQIAIVSWGMGCGRKDHPGVYTRVSTHADWVRATLRRDLVVTAEETAQQADEKPDQIDPPKPSPEFDNTAGLAIAFDKGDSVRVGDMVSYRVTTRKGGYLAIFDALPDGTVKQIFPNARSLTAPGGTKPEALRLEPGAPLLVPNYRNPYRGFDVRITEPRGPGRIVAILSEEPLKSLAVPDGPKSLGSGREAVTTLERLRGELRQKWSARGLGPGDVSTVPPGWSVDVHEYVVR